MKTSEARELGVQLREIVRSAEPMLALARLSPILDQKIPFRILGHIGEALGTTDLAALYPFLDLLAGSHTQGGWVIIGTTLGQAYAIDPEGVFDRCAAYIIVGDVWYATDILGERVPGPALVSDFHPALTQLEAWRESPNRWVRRGVGVAVHLWAKRSRGEAARQGQVAAILNMLAPLFDEREIDAVKGIGWGLKTIGRMYPDLLTEWLLEQTGRGHRAIMLRKALTYLAPEQKASILEKM